MGTVGLIVVYQMCNPVQYVLDAAATGTGVKGSASRSQPTVTIDLLGAGAGHLGRRRRSRVDVNGRLPFKVYARNKRYSWKPINPRTYGLVGRTRE